MGIFIARHSLVVICRDIDWLSEVKGKGHPLHAITIPMHLPSGDTCNIREIFDPIQVHEISLEGPGCPRLSTPGPNRVIPKSNGHYFFHLFI